MDQNKQGNQSPETQQTKKPENPGQHQQSSQQNQQQSIPQNQQSGAMNQQPYSKNKGFTPSGSGYSSDQGEDEKADDRQEDAGQGSFTSQRKQSGEDGDQDKAGNNVGQSDQAHRSNTPGQA